MKLKKAARKILRNLVEHADRTVTEMIRERGGSAANVRKAGHWAMQSLGEVAMAAARGEQDAATAIKIVKHAYRLGQKY